MLQQVMKAPESIILEEVPVPDIKEDQVLIRIRKIGICGTDSAVFWGKHSSIQYPLTQGREAAGEIVAVGADVQNLFPGQMVTVQPQMPCETCEHCMAGKYNLCRNLKVMGFQIDGMAREYFAADADKVATLPKGVCYEEGTMIEPLAVAVHAVKRAGNVAGKNVLVMGAGPIGVITAQAAKGMGAGKVMITDISDPRLQIAKDSGISCCINTRSHDLGKALINCFGTENADVIYDCAGTDVTFDQAIRYADDGSRIILVAVFKGLKNVDLSALANKELNLYTTRMYRNEDYLDAIGLIEERKVNLMALVSKQFPFGEYEAAYRYLEENKDKVMKVIIDVK